MISMSKMVSIPKERLVELEKKEKLLQEITEEEDLVIDLKSIERAELESKKGKTISEKDLAKKLGLEA